MKHLSLGLPATILSALLLSACSKNVPLTTSPEAVETNNQALTVMCIPRPIVQSGTTNIPHPRRWMYSAAGGSDIAFFGGDPLTGNRFYGADIYNAATGTWTSASFPEHADFRGGAGCNTKIAIAGGGITGVIGVDAVHILDVNSGQWSTAHLSIPRIYLAAAGYGDKILFAGGMNDVAGAITYSRVDIYDATHNSWSTAELSATGMSDDAAAANNIIAFTGNRQAVGTGAPWKNFVDLYDVVTGQWSHSALPVARSTVVGIGAGNLLFFAGGWKVNGGAASDVCDIYNTTLKTWTTTHLAHCSGETFATTLGTKVLFYDDYHKTADVYDLCSKGWGTQTLTMPSPGSTAGAAGGKMLVGQQSMSVYTIGSLYTL